MLYLLQNCICWGGRFKKGVYSWKTVYSDIENRVTCKGVINATEMVDFASGISGKISRLYVDNNESVYVDKLLCVLDKRFYVKE